MPQLTYNRHWCQSCQDWSLFVAGTTTCIECGSEHVPTKLGDIPREKIEEQRNRFREKERRDFHRIACYISLDFADPSPLKEIHQHNIVESDAGLKAVRAQEKEKYDKDLADRKELAEKFMKAERNKACPCGSGKKYKNCHYTEVQERSPRWR